MSSEDKKLYPNLYADGPYPNLYPATPPPLAPAPTAPPLGHQPGPALGAPLVHASKPPYDRTICGMGSAGLLMVHRSRIDEVTCKECAKRLR